MRSAERGMRDGLTARPVLMLVLVVAAVALPSHGESAAVESFNRGNRQYKAKEYEEAVKSYERCLSLGARNAQVYYNLGNAYFQAGDLGRAALAYERARRLTPRDPQLLQNLHQASLLTRDEIEVAPKSGLGAALELGLSRVSVSEVSWATSLAYLLCIALLLVRLFAASEGARRALGGAALLCVVVFLVEAGALCLKLHHDRSDRSAVVLAGEVEVRSGPSENFDTVFKLHAGSAVDVAETRGLWHRVEASPTLRGWLPKDSVESVR